MHSSGTIYVWFATRTVMISLFCLQQQYAAPGDTSLYILAVLPAWGVIMVAVVGR